MNENVDLELILQQMISISINAGIQAEKIKEKKELADIEIEEFIRNNLKKFSYSFIGEEKETFLSLSTNRCFVIDPIDGSLNYQNGDKNWCVSIALLENNEPVLGVISIPEKNLVFYAQKFKGATLFDYQKKETRALTINYKSNLIELLGVFNDYNKIKEKLIDNTLNKKYIRFRHTGSIVIAALKLISGARGIIYAGKTHLYDIAAVLLILQESGGAVYFNEKSGLFIGAQEQDTIKKIMENI